MGTAVTAEKLRSLLDLQNQIAASELDLDAVMGLVVGRAAPLTSADGAVVEIADGEDMVYRSVFGVTAKSLGTRLKRRTSLSGRCVLEGKPLRCDDTETDARVDLKACRAIGVRSMICVPLLHDGFAVGVLKVVSQKRAAFDDFDVECLQLLARVIASSMRHAQLYADAVGEGHKDSLTGLWNRRQLDERLPEEIARSHRHGEMFSFALLDLDSFKSLNDRHGHAAGDVALRAFAALLAQTVRGDDVCFRIGGDEFGVLFPRASLETATAALDRVRAAVEEAKLGHGLVGLSAGAATFALDDDADSLFARADAALYDEKKAKKAISTRP
jgi:diguanylate cyclase (GGDEF)-like protein